jgi:hypothetical protein
VAPGGPSLFGPAAVSSLFFIAGVYTNNRFPVPQPAPETRFIDTLPNLENSASLRPRIASVVTRNGKIWCAQSSGLGGSATACPATQGLRIECIDPTLPLFDPVSGIGPIFNDGVPFPGTTFMEIELTDGAGTGILHPSIAVNCADDVLVGFSRGSAGMLLEAAYAMRLGTDPIGSLGLATTIKAGDEAYWEASSVVTTAACAPTIPAGVPTCEWGPYSATTVDPNDDKTLWTLQPYAAFRTAPIPGPDSDSRWGLWWARLGDCETRPVIVLQPTDVTACVGDPFSFTVGATTGSNPLTYQWRLDGSDIAGATSSTYSVAVSVAADEGTYDCVICGCGQEVSDPAILDFGQPTITTQPASQFAPLGATVSFTVSATPSLGSLSYQWFHGATPVGIDSPTHTVTGIVGQDYGDYSVVVSDACGPVTSDTALLKPPLESGKHLLVRLLDVYVTPTSKIGCVGGSVTLTANGYPPGSTFVWRKDGSPLVPAETNPTLVLSGLVDPGDEGLYDVVVTFASESDESNDVPLSIVDKPVITDQPNSVFLSSPGPVTFSVVATGQAPLSYQWQKKPAISMLDFQNIPNATDPDLVFENATSANAGTYRCLVRNLCGTTRSATANLTFL